MVIFLESTIKVLQNSGDLHIHTRYSDGSLDLEYVVCLAAKTGLGYISITDHDYFNDLGELQKLSEVYKIKIIPGVELSCMDFKRNRKVHILGYNLKDTTKLKTVCDEVLNSRKESSKNVVQSIIKKYNVIPDLIEKYKSKTGCIFETNILHALSECGYSNKICGEFYNTVFSGEDKFNFKHSDVRSVLKLIRDAGGKSVLAHPAVHNSFDLLDELILEGLIDGVEVWHPKNNNVVKERLYNIVKTNNLIATGGTDFHGLYNSSVVKIGDFSTPYVYLERILS